MTFAFCVLGNTCDAHLHFDFCETESGVACRQGVALERRGLWRSLAGPLMRLRHAQTSVVTQISVSEHPVKRALLAHQTCPPSGSWIVPLSTISRFHLQTTAFICDAFLCICAATHSRYGYGYGYKLAPPPGSPPRIQGKSMNPVSYTHLTLPTILLV